MTVIEEELINRISAYFRANLPLDKIFNIKVLSVIPVEGTIKPSDLEGYSVSSRRLFQGIPVLPANQAEGYMYLFPQFNEISVLPDNPAKNYMHLLKFPQELI